MLILIIKYISRPMIKSPLIFRVSGFGRAGDAPPAAPNLKCPSHNFMYHFLLITFPANEVPRSAHGLVKHPVWFFSLNLVDKTTNLFFNSSLTQNNVVISFKFSGIRYEIKTRWTR